MSGINQCEWANGIGNQVQDQDKVFCLKWPQAQNRGNPNDLELVASSKYFENGDGQQINLNGRVPVLGVIPDWLIAITVLIIN